MRIQIVLQKNDLFCRREGDIADIAQDLSVVDGRTLLGDLDVPSVFLWSE
jgi:hypothetical protein